MNIMYAEIIKIHRTLPMVTAKCRCKYNVMNQHAIGHMTHMPDNNTRNSNKTYHNNQKNF